MKCSIKPLSDILVIKPIVQKYSAQGISLPEPKDGELRQAEVVAAHAGWYGEGGIWHDPAVKVGDVIFHVYKGTPIEISGEKAVMLHERDVLGRLQRPGEDAPKPKTAPRDEE